MTKLTTHAFTEYFGDVMPITILSYDNNKYVSIRKADGTEDEIKRGYIFADKGLTRPVREVDWHIHGGGTRKSYRSRNFRTEYDVFVTESLRFTVKNKAEALAKAVRLAKKTGNFVEVTASRFSDRFSTIGWFSVNCSPEGTAVQFGGYNRRRGMQPKWLRGYGKVPRALKQMV